MKRISFLLVFSLFAATVLAEQTVRPDGMGGWVVEDSGGCGSLYGGAQGACIAEQQRIQQQQLRQQEVIQQQQIENQRLQNELLRRQLKQQPSAPQVDYSETPEFRNWQAANPWFGTDRPKTEFALLYAKQLRQEHPDLIGRPFFDAVSAKVIEVFNINK